MRSSNIQNRKVRRKRGGKMPGKKGAERPDRRSRAGRDLGGALDEVSPVNPIIPASPVPPPSPARGPQGPGPPRPPEVPKPDDPIADTRNLFGDLRAMRGTNDNHKDSDKVPDSADHRRGGRVPRR